ncbi:KTSC domain-containing protein [Paenibacillus agricola]|uniref:KTSC domain-containing protein n=1 Tax=Paenibacillus agricola TaxID=2716264 RepID=A0ABX0JE18_9BACL|nr:KTSC domain-containing protein [Paenibacillus agricola]NHN32953.1 KTSC domain-containing protein [Paenibacillus agricola]
MQVIPVSSKQIAFVSYDGKASQIYVHFHAGAITVCKDIGQEQIQKLLLSDKPYDFIMELTCEAGQTAKQA